MTPDPSEPRRRELNDDVAATRAALRLLRPFLAKFENWNELAARYNALAVSSFTDEEQKQEARARLTNLRGDVVSSFEQFAKAVAGHDHSRVDDAPRIQATDRDFGPNAQYSRNLDELGTLYPALWGQECGSLPVHS